MVALKAGEVERFVAAPPADVPLVLVFGPDAGLVSERAAMLAAAASGRASMTRFPSSSSMAAMSLPIPSVSSTRR